MTGQITHWGQAPHLSYGTWGISGSGAIVRAEKKLARAKANCAKWTEEYQRRAELDASKKGVFKWAANQLRKVTKSTSGAKRKADEWCAKVSAYEQELAALRQDIAASPDAQILAAQQQQQLAQQQAAEQAMLIAQGGASPFKILGFAGLGLAVVGGFIFFFLR